jgi:hypothetical protein
MSRPHEDIERHTLVDHRPGGAPVSFPPGAWCAIEIAHAEAGRKDAVLSAYETLIEKARTSAAKARAAAVLGSANGRRVVALLELDGHEAFGHVAAAWGDQRLEAQHRAVAESGSLALYRLFARAGDVEIDPGSTDAYAFERVAIEPQRVRGIVPPIVAAAGFRGVLVFGADSGTESAVVYRFTNAEQFEAFRAGAQALGVLGAIGIPGESLFPALPVKTFPERVT